jgi:hypothetical protein
MEVFEKRREQLQGRKEKMDQQVAAIERLRDGVSIYAGHVKVTKLT